MDGGIEGKNGFHGNKKGSKASRKERGDKGVLAWAWLALQ
jgi:hypothetical protein